MRRQISTFFLASFALTATALSCPTELEGRYSPYLPYNGGDLCGLADRYEKVKASLAQKGIDASRIGHVRAPRFIYMPHWKEKTNNLTTSFDPRFMYDRPGQPKGSVWAGWDRTAVVVERDAREVVQVRKQNPYAPFELRSSWSKVIHLLAMESPEPRVAGRFRTRDPMLGPEVKKATAPEVNSVWSAIHSNYPSLKNPNKTILQWSHASCVEDMPPDIQKRIGGEGREANYKLLPMKESKFTDPANPSVQRMCGFYHYADADEIPSQLEALHADVNRRMNALLLEKSPHIAYDPIYIAARAQRWYVSIHPFDAGNGRTSRFIMDAITQSVGLPAAVLEDMNADLRTSENDWAMRVGEGLVRVVDILEACDRNPADARCGVIPPSN